MEIFASPLALILLLFLPLLVWVSRVIGNRSGLKFSDVGSLKQLPASWRVKLRPCLKVLRFLCLIFLVVALARPRKGVSVSKVSVDGVAINLVVDRSSSMQETMNYKGKETSRFDISKKVIGDFVKGDGESFKGREGDLIGLITFARYPDTTCPLVQSHDVLIEFLRQTKLVQLRSEDGTAIGEAVALAGARLQNSEKQILENNKKLNITSRGESEPDFTIKSKIIILLTDGVSNVGDIQPIEAAKMAKEWGIKIYTIGIGSDESKNRFGNFAFPRGAGLDETLLKEMAEMTGGFYSRADNPSELEEIYEKIDKLEETEIKSISYTDFSEKFSILAVAALWLLGAEIFLSCTVLRKIP